MPSTSKSLLLALCLSFLSSTSIAQFTSVGTGSCVDSSGFTYDYLQTTGIASTGSCQSACSSVDTTNLRGLQYEGTICSCLYENGAGVPANAFAEGGTEPGSGSVASANSTFATFTCYSYGGDGYRNRGTGGCVDSSGNFYSYAVPFNARGSQTLSTCQSACTAAGTSGLVGLDYDGECYCLYTAGSAPSTFFTSSVSSGSGSGTIGTTNGGSGTCQRFGRAATPPPTPPPTLVPVAVPVAAIPVVVPGGTPTFPTATTPATPTTTTTTAKAPKVKGARKKKGAKSPSNNRASKLVATPTTPAVTTNAKAPKRRLKVHTFRK